MGYRYGNSDADNDDREKLPLRFNAPLATAPTPEYFIQRLSEPLTLWPLSLVKSPAENAFLSFPFSLWKLKSR